MQLHPTLNNDESIDQLVDQMVIRLDAVAPNMEKRGTSRSVGRLVFWLDAVAASYYTKEKRSTG